MQALVIDDFLGESLIEDCGQKVAVGSRSKWGKKEDTPVQISPTKLGKKPSLNTSMVSQNTTDDQKGRVIDTRPTQVFSKITQPQKESITQQPRQVIDLKPARQETKDSEKTLAEKLFKVTNAPPSKPIDDSEEIKKEEP